MKTTVKEHTVEGIIPLSFNAFDLVENQKIRFGGIVEMLFLSLKNLGVDLADPDKIRNSDIPWAGGLYMSRMESRRKNNRGFKTLEIHIGSNGDVYVGMFLSREIDQWEKYKEHNCLNFFPVEQLQKKLLPCITKKMR